MADGVALPASGVNAATDDAGAAGHVQIVKLAVSANGDATVLDATAANGLEVDVTRVQGSAAAANAAVSVGTSSTTIKASNATRQSILVQNAHASNVLYVGQGTVTTANAVRLNPGDWLEIVGYTGAVSGIASAASTDVRFFEVG